MTTQTEDVLALLREGPLTPLKAWAEIGVYRLGARIFDLRQKGYVIERDDHPYTTTRGRKVTMSFYSLIAEPKPKTEPYFKCSPMEYPF